jgi:outer membrane protein assembly factor BamE
MSRYIPGIFWKIHLLIKKRPNELPMQKNLTILILSCTLSACSYNGSINLPGLYRIDIQQGNIIDQDMLDRLRPGMDKFQVGFILGTPAISDPFHRDQWDYIFSMAEESEDRQQRHVRVHFVDNKLAYIDGDVVVSNREITDAVRRSRTVEVPPGSRPRGNIFSRMFNVIPFVGDDEPRRAEPADSDQGSDEEDQEADSTE